MAVLIYAHPYPNRSIANRVLLNAVSGLSGLDVHSLYDTYPDFDIDVDAEQSLLLGAELVIWQHPMYWYSVPGLLKHWFDKVLARGWAYGQGGDALQGKRCLWVVTTGGDEQAFGPNGMHQHPLPAFVPPIEQTARFCGMRWLEPVVLHGAHRLEREQLLQRGREYRSRLEALLAPEGHQS